MISLAAGAPNPDLFPFQSAEVKLRDGGKLVLDEAKMKVALQYGASAGYGFEKFNSLSCIMLVWL